MSPTTTAPPSPDAILAANQDWPFRFKVLRLDEMYVDVYQRPLSSFVAKIVADFKPGLLGSLTVSERPKRGKNYAIIDGQTRAEAMRQLGFEQAPCLVFFGLTQQDEALQFAELQRLRKNITPMVRFNAERIGGVPRARELTKLAESEGYKITDEPHDYQLKAVVALERLYDDDPERLRTTLRLIKATWDQMPFATNERMLKGVAGFLSDMARSSSEVDEERFVDRLGAITPSEVERRALLKRDSKGISSGTSVKYVVEVIHEGYRTRAAKR